MKIIGISGSLRKKSYNSALLEAACQHAPTGMEIERAEIGHLPLYNADVQADGFPAPVQTLADQIRNADGVLIATPEYNYSVPGCLKNALDWVSRVDNQPFGEKPVAIMGASMSTLGTARAQYHLRQIFVYLNGRVMNQPEVFVATAQNKFDDSGTLVDEATDDFLKTYMNAVATWVQQVQKMSD